MTERTPYDGKPYYCALCGLGWAEYLACEEAGCELETVGAALTRVPKDSAEDALPDLRDEYPDEWEEAVMNCSKMPDGYCLQAGSEYCEFECPFR